MGTIDVLDRRATPDDSRQRNGINLSFSGH